MKHFRVVAYDWRVSDVGLRDLLAVWHFKGSDAVVEDHDTLK